MCCQVIHICMFVLLSVCVLLSNECVWITIAIVIAIEHMSACFFCLFCVIFIEFYRVNNTDVHLTESICADINYCIPLIKFPFTFFKSVHQCTFIGVYLTFKSVIADTNKKMTIIEVRCSNLIKSIKSIQKYPAFWNKLK